MIVSYNLLNSYFKNSLPSVDELVEALIPHSFEIEGVEKVDNDFVIDIDVLSNRGHDCLSHFGIAKEIAVVLDKEVHIPESKIDSMDINTSEYLDVKVETDLLPRINKRLIVDLKVGPSPDWLVDYLKVLGQKSINNVVDITNYVMFETGQPIHAFDYDKISGDENKKTMIIRMAKDGEELSLLDRKELNLDSDSLVWADSEKPLDLAGIKGGASTGVTEETKRIVLSACNFDPVHIRKTRQRHKVITDASRRFEHEPSPELTMIGVERASVLLSEIAGGKLGSVIDIYPIPVQRSVTEITVDDVNSLVGINISDGEIEEILNRFTKSGVEWKKDEDTYLITWPYDRLDVNDLHETVEEIARIYGYNNVKTSLAPQNDFTPKVNKIFYYNSLLKKMMVEQGFSEVYGHVMRVSEGGDNQLEINNPLNEEMSFMRSQLFDSLFASLELNSKNIDFLGLDQIRIFEIGKVFSLNNNQHEEHWALGIAVLDTKGWKGESAEKVIENIVDYICKELGVDKSLWSIEVQDGGIVAEVNTEELIKKLDTPNGYGDVLSAVSSVKYRPFSQYPSVLRDIALWVPEKISYSEVLDLITQEAGPLLVRIRLFDQFNKDGKQSYAYKLVFQSMGKTLTDLEVGDVMKKIENFFNSKEGYKVR
jgi:phenylalanyl-tRNA synthetase beta chain